MSDGTDFFPTVALGDVCAVALGLPIARHAGRPGASTPVVRSGALDDHVLTQAPEAASLALDPDRLDKSRIRQGDILLTARSPVVRSSLVGAVAAGAVADANIMVLRCRPERLRPPVLWAWLQSRAGRYALNRISRTSTSTVALGVREVARIVVPIPPAEEQARLAAMVLAAEDAWFYGVLTAHRQRAACRAAVEGVLIRGSAAPSGAGHTRSTPKLEITAADGRPEPRSEP